MLELIPQKFIESVIILAIFAVLGLLVMGIKLAIEDEESKPESKVVRGLRLLVAGASNAVGFAGGIGALLLAFILLIALPAYVVVHFIIKFW